MVTRLLQTGKGPTRIGQVLKRHPTWLLGFDSPIAINWTKLQQTNTWKGYCLYLAKIHGRKHKSLSKGKITSITFTNTDGQFLESPTCSYLCCKSPVGCSLECLPQHAWAPDPKTLELVNGNRCVCIPGPDLQISSTRKNPCFTEPTGMVSWFLIFPTSESKGIFQTSYASI